MTLTLPRSLYLIALAHLVIELCSNFLPVIYPILIETMGLTFAQIGFIALVATTCTTLAQPLFGYLSDRWDPAKITLISIIWLGLLMGLVGFAWNYLSLLVLVGVAALGSAAFHPAGATIAAAVSRRQRGTAVSIFSVGGNLGSALSPILITTGLAWLGLGGTGVLMPVAILAGLLFYWQLGRLSIANERPSGQTAADRPPSPTGSAGSTAALILIIAAVMTRSWFQTALITYLPNWLQSRGWSLASAGQILSVLLVALAVGSLVGGVLSDRVGGWQVMLLSLGLMAPAQWGFLSSTGLLQIGFVGLIGVLIGSTFPVTIVMAQEARPSGIGLASALVMGLGWLPGGIGASVTGFIADQSSLTVGLQSLLLPPVLGVLCIAAYAILLTRRPSERRTP